jgi:hypothetical protein
MRNVQRTASCGVASAHDGARERENCRSNGTQAGAIALGIATHVAFNSDPAAPFASGWEIGAVFFFDVAQQALFAQQPAWQAFWLDALDRMQVRAETPSGAATSVTTSATEIIILRNIELFCSTSKTTRRIGLFIHCLHFRL